MKPIVILLFLTTTLNAYPLPSLPKLNRCQFSFINFFQKSRSFQTERKLSKALDVKGEKGAEILRKMLQKQPEPSLQIKIAKVAGKIVPEGLDILKEMLQWHPLPEVQEQIIHSALSLYNFTPVDSEDRVKIIQFAEEWLKNKELTPPIQALFVQFAIKLGSRKGFDLLHTLSDQYPSLDLSQPLAIINSQKI